MSTNQPGSGRGEWSSEADAPTRITHTPAPATNPAFAPTVTTGALREGAAADRGSDSPVPFDRDTAVADNKLGSYRLEKRLGIGGMGEVYLGIDINLERPAAIKVIRRDFAEVPGALDRLKIEAQAAARLHHPNIVSVYQFGEEDGRYFIAFEYVPGRDLAKVIQEDGPMEPLRALRIIRQAASALRYAAENKIIHRDIKPSNLILLDNDVVKVADFGLAKRLDADTKLTRTDMVVGSPSYMSPEQGLGKSLDFRADIYSLGCTLFALLMGEAPYSASTPLAVMMHHANSAVPEPEKLKNILNGRLLDLLKKMLAKRALERHTSYEQLLRELDELIGAPAGKRAFSMQGAVRHGALPAVVFLAIGLGIAWGVGQRGRARLAAPSPAATTNVAAASTTAPQPVASPVPTTPAPAVEVAAAAAPGDRAFPIAQRLADGSLGDAAGAAMRGRDIGIYIHQGLWDSAQEMAEGAEASGSLDPEELATIGRIIDCIDLARQGERRLFDEIAAQAPFELRFFAGQVRFVGTREDKILYEAPPGTPAKEGVFNQLERRDRHLLSESVYNNATMATIDEAFAKALFLHAVVPHTEDLYFDQLTTMPGFAERGASMRKSWTLWKTIVKLGSIGGPPGISRPGPQQGLRPGPGGGLPGRPLRRDQQPPQRRN